PALCPPNAAQPCTSLATRNANDSGVDVLENRSNVGPSCIAESGEYAAAHHPSRVGSSVGRLPSLSVTRMVHPDSRGISTAARAPLPDAGPRGPAWAAHPMQLSPESWLARAPHGSPSPSGRS